MSKPAITPFADDAASVGLGGLTVENGSAAMAIYGQADLTRDKAGLATARALLNLLQDIVHTLEADPALPDHVAASKPTKAVKNPFS